MPKEKYSRNIKYKSISEIGSKNRDVEKTNNKISMIFQKIEQYNLKILKKLIEEYGEVQGIKQFELMMLEANDRKEKYQNLDASKELKDVKSNKKR